MIHAQGQNEFWLIDLGSANGTYLNGRRVSQPTKLHDSDVIAVGDHRFQFFHPEQSRPTEIDSANKTIQEIRNLTLWLLVADVEGATELAKRASDDQAARVMGRWLAECKQVIDDNDGTINKFLGDGFFAYWTESEGRAAVVARTLEHFKKVVACATNGQAVVLQFHGSPDIAHPWVHTPPERLREYMAYLKENGFRCIAIRDLEPPCNQTFLLLLSAYALGDRLLPRKREFRDPALC